MTPKEARDTLPDVTVTIDGHTYPAVTRGRKLEFARVIPIINGRVSDTITLEYAWGVIARAATRGTTLEVNEWNR